MLVTLCGGMANMWCKEFGTANTDGIRRRTKHISMKLCDLNWAEISIERFRKLRPRFHEGRSLSSHLITVNQKQYKPIKSYM